MTSGDLAAWASLVLGVIAAVGTAFAFLLSGVRERRRALADLHAALTSGEIADARHVVGTLLYGVDNADRPSRLDSISAYFALIWAMQRARNTFRAYRVRWRPLRRLGSFRRSTVNDASAALTWNMSEIAENIVEFHDRYADVWDVEDRDAWSDIAEFIDRSQFLRQGDER